MNSNTALWIGRILSAIVILFLAFDGIIHVLNVPAVAESSMLLGFPPGIFVPLGIIELVCLLLYVIPRTSVLGAILLTGYLGGAIATNVRIDAPMFSHVLFPVYVGVMLWGGLYLCNPRVQELICPGK